MSDGIYVRVTYRDEICFEKKFRVISGDTIVLSVDDLVAEKIAAEREACAKVCKDLRQTIGNDANGRTVASHCAIAIRARSEQWVSK